MDLIAQTDGKGLHWDCRQHRAELEGGAADMALDTLLFTRCPQPQTLCSTSQGEAASTHTLGEGMLRPRVHVTAQPQRG